ncbi:hypothetical protein [Legionella sp. km772]|uniref:hypothetical protein n=1 Tax=Legionella sp. km772 TaxID=2498111 RepID=UPI000F8C936A|nr:hypothetical protein [Legionella sp. km772]RUR14084.1 hypothetical protein ELY15_00660 [Legionella sp. km772]
MRYTLPILLAFILALLGTFFMLNMPIYDIELFFIINRMPIFILLLIIGLLTYKGWINGFKKINRYSWGIIVFYLSGTLIMEYQTHQYSVPFEGIFITTPLILAFIFWSQKSSDYLLSIDNAYSSSDGFKVDLFLITTAFLVTGCISLITEINNVDLRGFWPFYLFFISVYGFIFSLTYSEISLQFKVKHKNYTLCFSAIIVLLYSLLFLFPKHNFLFDLVGIEPFYGLLLIMIGIHFLICFMSNMKRKTAEN